MPLAIRSRIIWPIAGARRSQPVTRQGKIDLSIETGIPSTHDVHGDGHFAMPSLKRVDVAGLSPSQVRDIVDFSQPCILTGVLSSPDCETWCDALLDDLGEAEVDFQIRDNKKGLSQVFRSTLTDFVYGLQDESTHDKSW